MIRRFLTIAVLLALMLGPVTGCKLCYLCTNDELARDNAALVIDDDAKATSPAETADEESDSDA